MLRDGRAEEHAGMAGDSASNNQNPTVNVGNNSNIKNTILAS